MLVSPIAQLVGAGFEKCVVLKVRLLGPATDHHRLPVWKYQPRPNVRFKSYDACRRYGRGGSVHRADAPFNRRLLPKDGTLAPTWRRPYETDSSLDDLSGLLTEHGTSRRAAIAEPDLH